MKFNSQEKYKQWAQNQDWYQSISLSCGYKTPGYVDSEKRIKQFSQYNFEGKRVLDIGCNSGLYCLTAKRMGAKHVTGIDINTMRLEQARIIAENEGHEITYLEKGIEEVPNLGVFDIVICIAVLTEIPDLLGSIETLKNSFNEKAYIEMDIAEPFIYIPRLYQLLKFLKGEKPSRHYAEARRSKRGWMMSPSMGLLRELFGNEFEIKDLGQSLRYRLLEISRVD